MTRPETIDGTTRRRKTPCGNMYITINKDGNEIVEIFTHLGKPGTCPRAFLEALGRVTSLAIRKGVSSDDIVKTLAGIRCADSNNINEYSCPHTLSNAIKEEIEKNKEE